MVADKLDNQVVSGYSSNRNSGLIKKSKNFENSKFKNHWMNRKTYLAPKPGQSVNFIGSIEFRRSLVYKEMLIKSHKITMRRFKACICF